MSLPRAARLGWDVPAPDAPHATVLLVAEDGSETVIDRVGPFCDMRCVDTLMRFHLQARRSGARLRLRDVSDELRGLLELAGLADVLGLEPRREPELREQLGVDEVVQPGDAAG